MNEKIKIYLVDYLGEHTEYSRNYVTKLKGILEHLEDSEIKVISNYSDSPEEEPFLVNQYRGRVWDKTISLYRNYRRLNRLVADNPDAVFIFITYGNQIDISYIRIISGAPKHIIDIQDIVAARDIENDLMVYDFAKTYAQLIENVISHSPLTDEFLDAIGFHGHILNLPPAGKLTDNSDIGNFLEDFRKFICMTPENEDNQPSSKI